MRWIPARARARAHGAALIWISAAAPLAAQGRIVERHDGDDAEGQIMAFYSAALAFSPVGAHRDRPGPLEIGLELSFIPPLSEAQRTAGGSKVESTNLAPVLPRPRLAVALPWGSRLEASWVPPVTAFGVTANLWAFALSRPVAVRGAVLVPRLAGSGGHATGAITCNDDLASQGRGDSLYYAFVCHGRESADRFSPRALSAELTATRPVSRRIAAYGGVGTRLEHTRFGVGVRLADGRPDPDHPLLEMHAFRAYLLGGSTVALGARAAASAELFYAPGAVFTVRTQATLRLGRR